MMKPLLTDPGLTEGSRPCLRRKWGRLAGPFVLAAGLCTAGLLAARAELKDIYDSKADGEQLVTDGLKQAKQQGKRVLLQFGANWCPDCHAMHRLFESNREIADTLKKHYVVVMVDVDNRSGPRRNAKLIERYGNPFENRGIPALVVLDSAGTQLTNQGNNPLKDDDHRHPEKVLAFLRQWAPTKSGK